MAPGKLHSLLTDHMGSAISTSPRHEHILDINIFSAWYFPVCANTQECAQCESILKLLSIRGWVINTHVNVSYNLGIDCQTDTAQYLTH